MKFTIGELKEFIEKHNLSDDTEIVFQRIEDIYFEKYNWQTINKEGEQYHNALKLNKKIKDKEQYPELNDDWKIGDEKLESLKDQYIQCSCAVFYDKNYLYLDAHY